MISVWMHETAAQCQLALGLQIRAAGSDQLQPHSRRRLRSTRRRHRGNEQRHHGAGRRPRDAPCNVPCGLLCRRRQFRDGACAPAHAPPKVHSHPAAQPRSDLAHSSQQSSCSTGGDQRGRQRTPHGPVSARAEARAVRPDKGAGPDPASQGLVGRRRCLGLRPLPPGGAGQSRQTHPALTVTGMEGPLLPGIT
jgi:hypothetical protein